MRDLVTLINIVPTFCDFPIAPRAEARGVSLGPSRSGVEQPRHYVTSHPRFDSAAREGRMLRTERHKYVAFDSEQRPEQLFDLLTDPEECGNLAGGAGSKGLVQQHRALLRGELLRAKDEFCLPG